MVKRKKAKHCRIGVKSVLEELRSLGIPRLTPFSPNAFCLVSSYMADALWIRPNSTPKLRPFGLRVVRLSTEVSINFELAKKITF